MSIVSFTMFQWNPWKNKWKGADERNKISALNVVQKEILVFLLVKIFWIQRFKSQSFFWNPFLSLFEENFFVSALLFTYASLVFLHLKNFFFALN